MQLHAVAGYLRICVLRWRLVIAPVKFESKEVDVELRRRRKRSYVQHRNGWLERDGACDSFVRCRLDAYLRCERFHAHHLRVKP
jgi:hypothetical protein